MSTTSVLLIVCGVLGLWGLGRLIFSGGKRRSGVLMIIVSVVGMNHAVNLKSQKAIELGFLSLNEQYEAENAGITDAAEWKVKRSDIRAKQTEAEAATRSATLKESAESGGFTSVASYEKALAAGFKTNASYENHLKTERFFRIPQTQSKFIKAITNSRQAYNSAANDLVRGGARAKRKRDICSAVRGRRIKGWVGKLTQLTTNSEGRGVITIEIADDVYIKTWNNALSDTFHRTLSDPNSRMFQKLSGLETGKRVKFSGRMFASDTDCVHEASLTMRGAMTSPEFIARFQAIATP